MRSYGAVEATVVRIAVSSVSLLDPQSKSAAPDRVRSPMTSPLLGSMMISLRSPNRRGSLRPIATPVTPSRFVTFSVDVTPGTRASASIRAARWVDFHPVPYGKLVSRFARRGEVPSTEVDRAGARVLDWRFTIGSALLPYARGMP